MRTQLDLDRSPGVVALDGKEYDTVSEGLATILNLRKSNPTDDAPPGIPIQTVFYNPIQQFNRDLSVLAIRVFAEDLAISRQMRQERSLQESPKNGLNSQKRKRDSSDSTNDTSLVGDSSKHPGSQTFRTEAAENLEYEIRGTDIQSTEECSKEKMKFQNQTATAKSPEVNTSTDSGSRVLNTPGQVCTSKVSHAISRGRNGTKSLREGFRILDALSATGLRALRYAKEIQNVTSVIANDHSASATASIKLNVQHNHLIGKVYTITGNALTHMYHVGCNNQPVLPDGHRGKYDVIDLDPYGTAVPFLDAAIQALYDGGLLCVTCTDSGVFASVGYLEKTFSQYGGLPLKGPQSHEAGLRLILHAIATSAAKYGIAIEPLVSLSIDFYARVFVRVHKSPAEVKLLAGKTMFIYNCDHGCGAWTTQFLAQTRATINKNGALLYKFTAGQAPSASTHCEHCGFKTHLAGPMWGGPLHNPHFIRRMLDELPSLDPGIYVTIPRMKGMLSTALDETSLDPNLGSPSKTDDGAIDNPAVIAKLDPSKQDKHPFYVIPSALAKVLHCVAPSDAALRGALLKLNYRVTRSHTKAGSIRTDAPWTVIWEVMREWVRQKAPIKADAIKEGTAGWGIMMHDRSRSEVRHLKKQLNGIIARVDDMEMARTELEALLYRVGKESLKNVDLDTLAVPASGNDVVPLRPLNVDFDEGLGEDIDRRKLVRYQLNPKAYWGPMARAKGTDSV